MRPKWGEFHIAACRGFMEFATQNAAAQRVIEWANGTHIPDETVYSTLQGNPQLGAPGAYWPQPSDDSEVSREFVDSQDSIHTSPYFNRYKVWDSEPTACRSGHWRHWVQTRKLKTDC